MASFANYDPSKVFVSFMGKQFVGFADGTFVTAERAEDAFSTAVGASGDVTRVRSRNRMGTVTVTLQAASPTNDDLTSLALTDEEDGTSYGPLQIKDLNGDTLINAASAWIKKFPSVEFAVESSNREWVFECAELVMDVAGSTQLE